MIRRFAAAATPALTIAALAAGCGDSSTTKTEADKGAPATEEARTTCTGGKPVASTGLPAAFPQPGELTITKVAKDGPTIVLDGYWTSPLPEAYREWKQQFQTAGYKVLHNELEDRDSEVNYQGSGRTGQVALRANCTEANTIRVHITSRPA